MENLQETIEKAKKVMLATNMPFVTVWKIGKLYGFNFEKYPVGYSVKEYGVKRTVVAVF
jgi:hypothetical protein